MTDDVVQRIEDALAKMTPGPWECQPTEVQGPDFGVIIIAGNLGGLVGAALPWPTEIERKDYARVEANAAGIVTLRNDAAEVVAEVKRLREALRHIVECDRQPERDRADHYQRVARAALEPQP